MRDRRVWPWDQAWYGEVAVELWFRLAHQRRDWFEGMMAMLPTKPPLLVWIGQFVVPFGLATGDVEATLLLVTLAANVITLTFAFLFGRAVAPTRRGPALVALLAVAASPLFVGIGCQFMTEPLQAAVVMASFHLALRAAGPLRPARAAVLLGLVVVAGLAIKASTPLYCGLAWASTAWTLWRRAAKGGFFRAGAVEAGLLCVLLVFAGAVWLWYARNAGEVLGYLAQVTNPDFAVFYGRRADVATKLAFWLDALDAAVAVPRLAGLVVIVGAVAAVLARAVLRGWSRPAGLALLAAVHLGALMLQFSSQLMEEPRFLAAAIPLVGVIVAVAASGLKPAVLAGAAAALLGQLAVVEADAFGAMGPSRTPWLVPLSRSAETRDIAKSLVAATCTAADRNRYVIVGVDEPDISANTLSFEAAKAAHRTGFRCYYTSLGYAETELDAALERVARFDPVAILAPAPTRTVTRNFVNRIAEAFARRLEASDRYRPTGETIGGMAIYRKRD